MPKGKKNTLIRGGVYLIAPRLPTRQRRKRSWFSWQACGQENTLIRGGVENILIRGGVENISIRGGVEKTYTPANELSGASIREHIGEHIRK